MVKMGVRRGYGHPFSRSAGDWSRAPRSPSERWVRGGRCLPGADGPGSHSPTDLSGPLMSYAGTHIIWLLYAELGNVHGGR
jgi:hypothetical protein